MPISIALIILLASALGMVIVARRKTELLVELPDGQPLLDLKYFYTNTAGYIKNVSPLKRDTFGVFLEKTLSRTRVVILRMENKISAWLQHLRKQSQIQKKKKQDHYWKDLNGSTKSHKQEDLGIK